MFAILKRVLVCAPPALLWTGAPAVAQPQTLDVDNFVQIVLRAHPIARQRAAFDQAARAERKAGRLIADPTLEYTRGHAHSRENTSAGGTETGVSLTQTIPWPGAFAAGVRAGNHAAEVLRLSGEAIGWEFEVQARKVFARLVAARALVEIAHAAEDDARSLRDFVARRTELGETREVDRLKSQVEWLRQRRVRQAAQRETEAAEAIARALAVEALPRPLAIRGDLPSGLPPPDRERLQQRLGERNPRLLSARAQVQRQEALAAQAHRGWVPDLAVSAFRDREIDKTSDGFSLGLRLPLWNANRGEAARATANRALTSAEADRLRVDLLTELEDRIKDLEVAGAQATLVETEILPSAAVGLRLARRTYEEGETSLLDLLDIQRTYRETEREAVESRFALAIAVTDIQSLVGPDFDPWR